MDKDKMKQTMAMLRDAGIDAELTVSILERLNRGDFDHIEPLQATGIPAIDGRTVIDRTVLSTLDLADTDYRTRLSRLAPEIPAARFGQVSGGNRHLDAADLEQLGLLLLPYLSYGVLNGGSATSFVDAKKNRAYDPALYALYETEFAQLAAAAAGKPKGITAAYLNPDGSAGASFLELKIRAAALLAERYEAVAARLAIDAPKDLLPVLPLFEMTSDQTDQHLRATYRQWEESPYLTDLRFSAPARRPLHAVQPLIAAYTHSCEGTPRRVFDRAWGRVNTPLGLPGGHGQNFQTLAAIYRELYAQGKRYVYLGNVDNLGYTPDATGLAYLALTGKQGAFEFAFRTGVDVKGGVLIRDQYGKMNCADIGAAIPFAQITAAESRGSKVLFNCATGLFDLQWLVDNLERIIRDLPMRISDQDKDAGRYSQAEQITWEIIGMMDDFLVFGVNKYRRFLAAKMLVETLLTSGLHLQQAAELQPTARALHNGLQEILQEVYRLELRAGCYVARSKSLNNMLC